MSSLKELITINTYILTKIKLELVILNIIILSIYFKIGVFPIFYLKKRKVDYFFQKLSRQQSLIKKVSPKKNSNLTIFLRKTVRVIFVQFQLSPSLDFIYFYYLICLAY
jgi:hypothetical protein